MSTPVHRLVELSLEAAAINREQSMRLYNTGPAIDSLGERLLALRGQRLTDGALVALLHDLRDIIALGDLEHGIHTRLAGELDRLALALYDRDRPRALGRAFGVKALARALRPALRDLESFEDPLAYVRAARTVLDLVERCPIEQLRSDSLRHELRAHAHDLLLRLIDTAREQARS